MKVLAFDQATKTGWAFGQANQPYKFGRWEMPKRPPAERLGWLFRKISDQIATCSPDLIVYEAPFMPRGADASSHWATIQWGQKIEAIVMVTADLAGVAVESYTSSEWRMTFCGFARSPKEVPAKDRTKWIKRAVRARVEAMGYEVRNDDESDAIAILHHALVGRPAAGRAQGDIFDMAEEGL